MLLRTIISNIPFQGPFLLSDTHNNFFFPEKFISTQWIQAVKPSIGNLLLVCHAQFALTVLTQAEIGPDKQSQGKSVLEYAGRVLRKKFPT